MRSWALLSSSPCFSEAELAENFDVAVKLGHLPAGPIDASLELTGCANSEPIGSSAKANKRKRGRNLIPGCDQGAELIADFGTFDPVRRRISERLVAIGLNLPIAKALGVFVHSPAAIEESE